MSSYIRMTCRIMPQDTPIMAPSRMPTGGVRMKIPDNPPKAAPSVKPRTNRLYKQPSQRRAQPRRVIQSLTRLRLLFSVLLAGPFRPSAPPSMTFSQPTQKESSPSAAMNVPAAVMFTERTNPPLHQRRIAVADLHGNYQIDYRPHEIARTGTKCAGFSHKQTAMNVNGAPYGNRTRLYNVKGCRPNR
jgi:hypothetical protein